MGASSAILNLDLITRPAGPDPPVDFATSMLGAHRWLYQRKYVDNAE